MDVKIVYDATQTSRIVAAQSSETLSILALLAAITIVVAAIVLLKHRKQRRVSRHTDHPAIARLRLQRS